MIFPVLRILKTNSLPIAVDDLMARLPTLRTTPFEPIHLVVPSSAIGRWVQQNMAWRLGVSANLQIDFAGSLIWSLARQCLPDLPAQSPFAPQIMVWRIDECLQLAAAKAGDARGAYSLIGRFLDTANAAERFVLARDLAAQFDRYLAFRMDWLEQWQKSKLLGLGQAEPWQAQLWRDVLGATQVSAKHPLERFETALLRPDFKAPDFKFSASAWPSSLLVLGLEGMAPRYIKILCALSKHIDVDIVQFLPSEKYFKYFLQNRRLGLDEAGADNLLLGRWGRSSAESMDTLLLAQDDYSTKEADRFDFISDTQSFSRLHAVQQALADAAPLDAAATPAVTSQVPTTKPDQSIQIHACHNLTRQLEVLHDVLMRLVESHPDLSLDQILVNCPDLDSVAASLSATWGLIPKHQQLAWRVVGAASLSSAVNETLLAWLQCARGAMRARDILILGEQALVQVLWDIDGDILSVWRRWFTEAGARAGLDIQAHDSLVRALDRLVAGYASDDQGASASIAGMVYPIAAAVNGEGDNGLDALDKLYAVLHQMASAAQRLSGEATLAQWAARLQLVCTDLFALLPYQDAQSLAQLRLSINQIPLYAKAAGANHRVSFDVFEAALSDQLAQSAQGASPTGAITFAPAGAFTHLPARVIMWLQCEDQSFPTSTAVIDWDLMAKKPRPADPNPQQAARGQFLSSLVAAQDYFLIFYNGFDQRSNEPRKASVLIEDLLAFVNLNTANLDAVGSNATYVDAVKLKIVNHPMHPFARAGGLPQRYQALWAKVADIAYGPNDRVDDQSFLSDAQREASAKVLQVPAAPNDVDNHGLSLAELLADSRLQKNFIDFYGNASRHWLNKHLQLRHRFTQSEPPLFEAFADQKSLLKIALNRARLEISDYQGDDSAALNDHPAFSDGPLSAAQSAAVTAYGSKMNQARAANPEATIDFIYGDARNYHKVSFWLRHWIACAYSAEPTARLLHSVDKGKSLRLDARDSALARKDLITLLSIYNSQTVPQPIFINAMFAWRKDPNDTAAIELALQGDVDDDDNQFTKSDMDDEHHALLWRGGAPDIQGMIPLWSQVFESMPEHLAPKAKKKRALGDD